MYTTRVARPRTLRPRHAVENQWDLLTRLTCPRPAPEADPVEMPLDPRAAAERSTTGSGRGIAADRSPHRRARQRRQPVPALAPALVRGDGRHARLSPRGRRVVVVSGPSERDAAAASSRARESSWRRPNRAQRALDRRVFAGRAARAVRPRGALHRRRQRPLHIAATSDHPDRRAVWTDVAGALGSVAQPDADDRVGRWRRARVPALRSARLRARRFPVPDADRAPDRRRRGGTRARRGRVEGRRRISGVPRARRSRDRRRNR